MEIKEYPKNLNLLAKNKHLFRFFDGRSRSMLIKQADDLANALNRSGATNPCWSFCIPRDTPFEFIQNNGLQVDISCIIEGKGNNISKQNFEIRIWSLDENLSYREGIDSPELRAELEQSSWKRVVSRFHFDLRVDDSGMEDNEEKRKKKKNKIPEPICHLQVGGDSGSFVTNGYQDIKENCWHPKKVAVPRFFHLPFDMILICEFILVNFFPNETEDLRKRDEWIQLVKDSEELFFKPYLEMYINYFYDDRETMLGNLIST